MNTQNSPRSQKRRIAIFDTTLRDGEQSPGCSMTLRDKLLVASHLEAMKVDVIEAGFAIASPGDFESVKAIAEQVKQCTVASLSRALKGDIDQAWAAVRGAARPRIHTFLATSPVHMQYKLRMTPDQVYEQAVSIVKYARNLCPEVQFSLEDFTRSEPEFAWRVIEGVIRAGAKIVNLPDTVGYMIPQEFGEKVRGVIEHVPNIGEAALAVHCHNDLGMAVANTLAAIAAGATQAECTINGIGERAGNAALEEVVMALKTRADYFDADSAIDTTKIYAASRCVTAVTGSAVQANKAIVGANAFAHESGIHQHGVMAKAETYEIMTPASIGLSQNALVLGKHSGKHALEARLKDLGFELSAEKMAELFRRFKELADKKKTVSDLDVEALARGLESRPDALRAAFDRFIVTTGNTLTHTATIRLKVDGEASEQAAISESGPIDASFRAINAVLGIADDEIALEKFSLSAVTGDADAQGEANVRVRRGGKVQTGRGVATDVIEASIRAYLNAVNALLGDAPSGGAQQMTSNAAALAAGGVALG